MIWRGMRSFYWDEFSENLHHVIRYYLHPLPNNQLYDTSYHITPESISYAALYTNLIRDEARAYYVKSRKDKRFTEIRNVLMISMEKIGSTTVMDAVKGAGDGFEIGRLTRHNMNEINISNYQYFIVPVREPIAKSISNYFETNKTIDIKEEIEFTLGFFDTVVFPITRIDVMMMEEFSYPYQVYSRLRGRLLVVSVEGFNEYLAGGLAELLFSPVQDFKVKHHPKGSKRFGPEYDQFIQGYKLDRKYLERIYQSNYCHKFGYNEVEKWVK